MKGLVPLAVGLGIAGGSAVQASAASASAVAAVRAAVARDMTIAVAPWIPCAHGRATPLTLQAVRAQQRLVNAMIDQTYAPNEPTHAGIRTRLRALIAAYGPGGAATRAGETLCDVGGGIDQVQARAITLTQNRAQLTVQAHEWNETVGYHNHRAFHFKPQAIIMQTDDAVLLHGHWLISRRGPVTFMTGAP